MARSRKPNGYGATRTADRTKWPPVLRQDIANMGEVQRGMRSKGFRGNLPNPLQEVMITNFHTNLARFMAAGAPVPVD